MATTDTFQGTPDGWRNLRTGQLVPFEGVSESDPEEPELGRLGIYHGGLATDESCRTLFGNYPDIASVYYQINQQNLNVSGEKARTDRGIDNLITITCKEQSATYYPQIVAKSGTGWTWLTTYVDRLQEVAAYAKSKGRICYATLDHEYEVKYNQGLMHSSITDSVYAQALTNFFERCASHAPDVRTVYWYGHADTTAINNVGSSLGIQPDVYALDPYSGSHRPLTETFAQTVKPKIDWLKGRSWYDPSAGIALGEFGADKGDGPTADAAMATYFFSDLRQHIAELGLEFAVFFNRNDRPYVVTLTNSTFPLSLQAVADSLAEGKD